MKIPSAYSTAVASYERGDAGAAFEVLAAFVKLHDAGKATPPVLQSVATAIISNAVNVGKWPSKRQGRPTANRDMERDAALTYWRAREAGSSASEATNAAFERHPRCARQIHRLAAKHRDFAKARIDFDKVLLESRKRLEQRLWIQPVAFPTLVERIAAGEFADLIAAALKAADD